MGKPRLNIAFDEFSIGEGAPLNLEKRPTAVTLARKRQLQTMRKQLV